MSPFLKGIDVKILKSYMGWMPTFNNFDEVSFRY
jgi:hypothetical protein